MRYITLVAFMSSLLLVFAEESVPTKASVVKAVIDADTKHTIRTIKQFELDLMVDHTSLAGNASSSNFINMLKARVKENTLILKSKDAKLQTVRATYLATEKLRELYAKKHECARKKRPLSEDAQKSITLYQKYVRVLYPEYVKVPYPGQSNKEGDQGSP